MVGILNSHDVQGEAVRRVRLHDRVNGQRPLAFVPTNVPSIGPFLLSHPVSRYRVGNREGRDPKYFLGSTRSGTVTAAP